MEYIQTRSFNLAQMGKTKNFCLRNVRLAYDIPPKYADAKLAMKENEKLGTLHNLNTIPNNVAVPVFTDKGVFGHVLVCDKGVYYSDGKKVGKPNLNYKWGELLNGVRVVKKATSGKINVGDSVIVNGRGTSTSKGGSLTKNFTNRKMKVVKISNGRYGCNQWNLSGAITGWFTDKQVKKA